MLAYLFSRYPVVSQTFCDSELLALEAEGVPVVVGSINPPPDSFRHPRLDRLGAEVVYPPPPGVLRALPAHDPAGWRELAPLVEEHEARYGPAFKAETRARNALYFAREFERRGVGHVHVHFANRATHTAVFMKRLGLPFSFTAHAKDFMVDLGSDELLREMCREAESVVTVSEFSRGVLAGTCPDSAAKIVRVYNGVTPSDYPSASPGSRPGRFRIASVGRLVAFKGFLDLVAAAVVLRGRGVPAELDIAGEGPERGRLEDAISAAGAGGYVRLLGAVGQNQVRDLLRSADAFALACTTDDEGGTDILPTVIIEAMATRLPVVSTRIAGVPEMVEHGETGLLVEPGAVTGLADALAELQAAPGRAAAMGEAGAALAGERFDTARNTRELLRHFGPAAGGTAAGRPPAPPGFAYLLGSWPGADPALAAETACALDRNAPVVALALDPGADPAAQPTGGVEFLPDGVVLESVWRRSPGRLAEVDALRRKLGPSVDGEAFYTDARRALYLAEALPKRGVHTVHAARSDAALVAWLVARLGGLRATFTAERKPAVARSLLARLAPDFAARSVADDALAAQLPGGARDELGLAAAGEPARARRRSGWLGLGARRDHPAATAEPPPGLAAWLDRLTRANG